MRIDYSGLFQEEKDQQSAKSIKLMERMVLILFVVVLLIVFNFIPISGQVSGSHPRFDGKFFDANLLHNPIRTKNDVEQRRAESVVRGGDVS